MRQRTWVIVGATSIIAKEFAHLAAKEGHPIRLIGRNSDQLTLIAKDIALRFQVPCEMRVMEMTASTDTLLSCLQETDNELDLFIAHSDFTENCDLNPEKIKQLIEVNILSTSLLIHTYLHANQKQHNIFYLSSVAACRGRAKNSLYGASKAAIEVYLQGLEQKASKTQHITIARLGFIDTKQTYGLPGIFYAASAQDCAKACWKANKNKKRSFYYPKFWWLIMAIIKRLPSFLFKKIPS
jgi:short-subunit dehydrogenase